MNVGDEDVLFYNRLRLVYSPFPGCSYYIIESRLVFWLIQPVSRHSDYAPHWNWKIVSMQILLREGFYSPTRNLPLGNWTVLFFFLLTLHTHAPMSRRFQYGAVFSFERRLINIPVTLRSAIIEYGFESKMSQGQINL